MSIDLTIASSPIDDAKFNPVAPEVTEKSEASVPVSFQLLDWVHTGSIDFSKPALEGYDGVGINKYGLYGVDTGTPKFLLTAHAFSNEGWGNAIAGEFRVGDDVKESNGTLQGKNWMRWYGEKGMFVQGPFLRLESSEQNLIGSPTFDNVVEFDTSGSINHATAGGFAGGACYKATGNGELVIFGHKTIDGANTIRGSIRLFPNVAFDGVVTVRAFTYDKDGVQVGVSSSVLSYNSDVWKRFNYVVRVDTDTAETFVLKILVTDTTAGEILIDDWSAYKVFQTGFSSVSIPETLQPPSKGVVIDRTGIRGYWKDIEGPLTKTFEISAANGNAYLRGSLLVNGYVHTGHIYKADNKETTNPLEVVYYSGCGINEHGVYGVKAEKDGSGNHVSSTAKFLLSAKDYNTTDDYYWGTGFNQGEVRIGDDIARTSSSTLRGNTYFWFDGIDKFRLKGIDLELTSGNYVWVGTPTTDGCGIGDAGIVGMDNGNAVFLLAADDINDGYWNNVKKGELRIGTSIQNLVTSNDHFNYLPGSGISLRTNGIYAKPGATVIGDNLTSLSNLTLTGRLLLTGGVNPDGTPVSYIGLTDSNGATYISKDGIAILAGTTFQAFMLGANHPWNTSTGKASFYVGSGYVHGSSLGADHLYFNGSTLDIAIGGKTVLHEGSAIDWSKIAGAGKPDDNATVGADWNDGTLTSKPVDADLLNDQQIWDDINSLPSSLSNASAGTLNPTHLGSTCYIDSVLYVGNSTDYIVLSKGSGHPYAASKSTDSGYGQYAWKLDYLGKAQFNTVTGIGDYLSLSAKYIGIGRTSASVNGGVLHIAEDGGSVGHAQMYFVNSSNVTQGMVNVDNTEITVNHNTRINLGDSATPIINIYAETTGAVNFQADTINMNSGYIDKINIGDYYAVLKFGGKSPSITGLNTLGNTGRGLEIWGPSSSGTGHYIALNAYQILIGDSGQQIGFFGEGKVASCQSVSSSANVATLIVALKKYGLIKD